MASTVSTAWPFQVSPSTLSNTLTCSSSISVVVVADLLGEPQVLRAQQLGQLLRDQDVEPAHLGERGAQALRDDLVREAVAGELRDVLGHVAHPLERRADAQRAHDDAQVAGDRLLAGEDLDGQLVEDDGELVDLRGRWR